MLGFHNLQVRWRVSILGIRKVLQYSILVTLFELSSPNLVYGQSDAETETVSFNIPSQTLPSALTAFARQAKVELAFAEQGFDGVQTVAVVGSYRRERALELLLAGTGLRVGYGSGDSVIVQRAEASVLPDATISLAVGDAKSGTVLLAQAAVDVSPDSEDFEGAEDRTRRPSDEAEDEQNDAALDEIVVTGTSIRGVIPESSPLEIYDNVDIRNTGSVTAEGFVSTLTQNNNTLTAVGSGASSREENLREDNAADLRGLGVGTTLVLLNGRRMAPSAGGRTADLSFIPLGAVERAEVLTDGASAVYGADAIGGVINFVLKDQLEGAQTAISSGAVDGGRERVSIDQSFGFDWEEGNAFLALSYMDQNDLDASDRAYSQPATPRTLVGAEKRTSALATISQQLPGKFNISGDLLYSTRDVANSGLSQFGTFSERDYDKTQTVLNLAIDRPVGETLHAEFLATYAEFASERVAFTTNSGIRSGPGFVDDDSRVLDVTAKLDGELIRLPGGAMQFSLGGGYSEEEIEVFTDNTMLTLGSVPRNTRPPTRDTKYAFTEFYVPLISPDQNIPGIRRLEFNLAARFTDYSDFGQSTDPKIGVLWSPVESLKIRGTYSESFRVPTMLQLLNGNSFGLLFRPAPFFPDIWSTDGSSTVLLALGGGSSEIGPEEAQTYTFGFDIDLAGLSISATYFNIDYTGRISEPDPSGGFGVALLNPQDFPSFFDFNPTVQQIAALLVDVEDYSDFVGCFCTVAGPSADPAAVQAATTVLFDNRFQNLAVSQTDGLDLAVNYTMAALGGDLSFGGHASKTFKYEQQAFPDDQPISVVDTVFFPVGFKARTYVSLQRERWYTNLVVNYADDYDNPSDAANPTIDSWTTVDLMFSYEVPAEGEGLLAGTRFSLSVQNVLDEDPPLLPGSQFGSSIEFPIGFDPTNSNPFGRIVNFQVSKQW